MVRLFDTEELAASIRSHLEIADKKFAFYCWHDLPHIETDLRKWLEKSLNDEACVINVYPAGHYPNQNPHYRYSVLVRPMGIEDL